MTKQDQAAELWLKEWVDSHPAGHLVRALQQFEREAERRVWEQARQAHVDYRTMTTDQFFAQYGCHSPREWFEQHLTTPERQASRPEGEPIPEPKGE
jgi:hypothetical protein